MRINWLQALPVGCNVRIKSCSNCHSIDHITINTTNYAAKYHCTNCDLVFDPDTWECPECQDDGRVAPNPFDDPAGFYCYRCDLAFNRLGFESEGEPMTSSDAPDDQDIDGEVDLSELGKNKSSSDEDGGTAPIGLMERKRQSDQE